jgi:hypothetical protein
LTQVVVVVTKVKTPIILWISRTLSPGARAIKKSSFFFGGYRCKEGEESNCMQRQHLPCRVAAGSENRGKISA